MITKMTPHLQSLNISAPEARLVTNFRKYRSIQPFDCELLYKADVALHLSAQNAVTHYKPAVTAKFETHRAYILPNYCSKQSDKLIIMRAQITFEVKV